MNQHLYRCIGVSTISLAMTCAAFAQSGPAPGTRTLSFKSTLSQYKPYTDEKTADWKAANDEVGKIGGWRTYLKQANEPDKAEPQKAKPETTLKPSTQSGVPAPVTPPVRATNPHAGHGSQ